ncbi:MAG: hypothetical protein K9G62_06380 [Alphaproteobacteria bacterium]|nr:hypothetical protein [Alphaproteobacteria bacterium]
MTTPITMRVLEMMASKICHDLISPIGAVNNGVEFMRDMGADSAGDAADLIAFSAAQASAKLQAYRMAYGAGGADANIKPEDVYKAIHGIIVQDKKIKQDWDFNADLGYGRDYPKGYCKLLACALLLAMDCLPRGGVLSVKAGANGTLIRAEGTNAAPRAGMEEALSLSTPIEKVEPIVMHGYLSGLLAEHYGFDLAVAEKGDGFMSVALAHKGGA